MHLIQVKDKKKSRSVFFTNEKFNSNSILNHTLAHRMVWVSHVKQHFSAQRNASDTHINPKWWFLHFNFFLNTIYSLQFSYQAFFPRSSFAYSLKIFLQWIAVPNAQQESRQLQFSASRGCLRAKVSSRDPSLRNWAVWEISSRVRSP